MIDPGRAFALEMFGEDGVQVRDRVPEVVRSSHESMVNAQLEADMPHGGTYGNIWRKVLYEAEQQLGGLPNARRVKVPRAGYSLVSFNDTVLFPWRYSTEADVDISSRRFLVSDARSTVFNLSPGQSDLQLDLREDHPELSVEERELVDGAEQVLRDHARVVVIAYASNRTALHDIQWGEASLGADGFLTMLSVESLTGHVSPALSGLGETGDGFSEGEIPAAALEVRDASSS